MSEGDVSLIRDEDVLRRMWQQTEDFSRKKEIRAHMYRLREERLRNLYSPEPSAQKGVEAAQTHVKSLLDQSFQGLKSKEVRDAGSPPKDFTYRGQDLKALSNAGWNVESENRTTDDGHTRVKSVHANIEGRYDVDGGKGQFAAVDHHKQAVTDYHDDNTSLKRNESSTNTAAHEQVVRKTDNGTEFSSSKSTSSTSNFQQVSSTKYEVPYSTDDYDKYQDTKNREQKRQVTNTSDYQHNVRSNYDSAELMSRKVEYPDDNTKVITESKRLPDGTTVTSTRREFRAPAQSTKSEHSETRNETKIYSTSSQQQSDCQSSQITRDFDSRSSDIVDSQRYADDCDFKTKQINQISSNKNDLYQTVHTNQHESKHFDTKESSYKSTRKLIDDRSEVFDKQRNLDESHKTKEQHSECSIEKIDHSASEQYISKRYENTVNKTDQKVSENILNDHIKYTTQRDNCSTKQSTNRVESDEIDYSKIVASDDMQKMRQNTKEIQYMKDDNERINNISVDNKKNEFVEKKTTTDEYRTTYQTDFTQKKISNDWSPTHQAWASTLRADTPTSSRPTTRASSPGSKTYQSSTSSLRSSVTPEKTFRRPTSRGGSPSKIDRSSPSRITVDTYSSSHSAHSVTESRNNRLHSLEKKPPISSSGPTSSPDRKPQESTRSSQSPEKKIYKPSISPERRPGYKSVTREDYGRSPSPKLNDRTNHSPEVKAQYPASKEKSVSNHSIKSHRSSKSPEKNRYSTKYDQSPDRLLEHKISTNDANLTGVDLTKIRDSKIPDRKPIVNQNDSPGRKSVSTDRKPGYMRPTASTTTSEKYISPDQSSPPKYTPSKSPERQPNDKIMKSKHEHYKFIDEETKIFTQPNQVYIDNSKSVSREASKSKSPSPIRMNPHDGFRAESPSLRSSLRKDSRSPSPPKGPVTFTREDNDRTEQSDVFSTQQKIFETKHTDKTMTITIKDSEQIQHDSLKKKKNELPSLHLNKEPKYHSSKARESSPTKFGTYDKKQRTEDITVRSKPDTETKPDSIKEDSIGTENKPRQNSKTVRESSPSKYGTYEKKHRREEAITILEDNIDFKHKTQNKRGQASPKKSQFDDVPHRSLRKNTSPAKSPSKDSKGEHATDFINIEKTTEETNRKSMSKDNRRQLVTPSTSPTRKPKEDETAPSTGQSSPTTSVSGFIYFSSPKTDTTTVTDLHEELHSEINIKEESTTNIRRPDTLRVNKSPSPSKIPCRSPSPEKQESPNKDNLPRKSSLKKNSTETSISPNEKPPTQFRVSPTDSNDLSEFPKHKVVKKDRPDTDSYAKPKPPLERRETYEERCRKILGMMDDNNTTTQSDSKVSSPTSFPCRNPQPKEPSHYINSDVKRTNDFTVDFLTHEQEETIKNIITQRENIDKTANKSKTTSRESSPTKLHDIISHEKNMNNDQLADDIIKRTTTVLDIVDKEMGYQKVNKIVNPVRINQSPESNTSQPDNSKVNLSTDVTVRISASPEREPNYMKHTTATTNKFESITNVTGKVEKHENITTMHDSPVRDQKQNNSLPVKKDIQEEKPTNLQSSNNRNSVSPDRKSSHTRPVTSSTTKTKCTTENTYGELITETQNKNHEEHNRSVSPSKPSDRSSKSPQRKSSQPYTDGYPKDKLIDISSKRSVSPEKKPNYMKSTTATSHKHTEIENTTSRTLEPEKSLPKKKELIKENDKRSRTLSPTKKVTETTKNMSDFIQFEREQEVLNRVQQSLRKLSPTRDERSPSREKSPGKSNISLQDIHISTETKSHKIPCEKVVLDKNVPKKNEPTDEEAKSKPSSRNVSPSKKPKTSPTLPEKNTETSNKPRSVSPKKPTSFVERPQSPQVSKASGIKPREQISTQMKKSSNTVTSSTRIDKSVTDEKKPTSVTKQNSSTKTSIKSTTTTSKLPSLTKPEPETKRIPSTKGLNKENVSPRKDDTKVTRTTSDSSIRYNKTSPQRVKSKPEIQVTEVSTKIKHTTTKTQKYTNKELQTKLAPKPKSATALNISIDEDDVIIDVELAKSSRENSPDRICPTPINFLDDVGTPRFPDEVSEPDDEFRRRTYHTIHETESLVDDIVEICEDDELFVKQTDFDKTTQSNENLVSGNDNGNKLINKLGTTAKNKNISAENLKSDECLLSVSEKVNKFAQGPKDSDKRNPSRRIVDEYDTETIYQDDYTKLSVNDKAHLFVETAENSKVTKMKPVQKIERPDLSNVDESLKSDDCLLSVSDKVNKFVKTAEQFLTETHESEDNVQKVHEKYEKIMKHITQDEQDVYEANSKVIDKGIKKNLDSEIPLRREETSSPKFKDNLASNFKQSEKVPVVKITTLRSSEAVKKAKALFENIASTTQKAKDINATKLTDIGVLKKSFKNDRNVEDTLINETDLQSKDYEVDYLRHNDSNDLPKSVSLGRSHQIGHSDRKSTPTSPQLSRKSPTRETIHTTTTSVKTTTNRYPGAQTESPKEVYSDIKISHSPQPKLTNFSPVTADKQIETEKLQERIPSYQRPTKTSQIREEKNITEEVEVSTRRGSGKFGVELRKTSVERLTQNNERRRSSTEHHQPCIEDIFDLDLLEQMLEKVVGYEQRRRIRAQIRVTKKKMESEHTDTSYIKTSKYTTIIKNKSPEHKPQSRYTDRYPKSTPQKTSSPERKFSPHKTIEDVYHSEQVKPLQNGLSGEHDSLQNKRQMTESPEKSKILSKTSNSIRQPSPDKKTRVSPPSKSPTKSKTNKFNEYATAYMKKVGLNDIDKSKSTNFKTKVTETDDNAKNKSNKEDYENVKQIQERVETKTTTILKAFSERTSSKEAIEITQRNGKRSPSPDKKRGLERQTQSPSGRLYQRSPSPDFKRTKSEKNETIIKTVTETEPRTIKKETIINTVYENQPKDRTTQILHDVEKKVFSKQIQEEKPSWVTNRILKKSTPESRPYGSKKLESEKTKYRAVSPSKVISKPIDVITSSYGPGPLDANGRPLFGIKALRNGATNYQVKGTVIRQEFHSRNGGEPEGTVSVTAYSTEPEDLEKLLQCQGERPSRLHGLAAITTTKKFGGETGSTLKEVHSKEERASLDQFTHSDRKIIDSRIEDLDSRTYSTETTDKTRSTDTRDKRTRSVESKEDRKRSEERKEKMDRREDRKTVRQSSVKSITEKYIKNANEASRSERSAYPKAGLILRTTNLKDSVSSDSSAHAGLNRTDSDRSLDSGEETQVVTSSTDHADGHTTTTVTTRTRHHHAGQERSFLDSTTKVSGVQDILTRMKNADIVIQEGDSSEDSEARALLNKFLGATVLMAGMQSYVTERPGGKQLLNQESPRGGITSSTTTRSTTSRVEHLDIDLDQCWDETLLRKLLEDTSDYEQRRRIRARIRTLMAEQEACASAVTDALGAAGEAPDTPEIGEAREEEEVTVTSSVRRDSSEKTVSSSTTTKTSKVIESVARPAPKPVSPFAKFRQLEKQNSTSSPNSPQTPQSPGSPAQPYFKFTDPALQASALTIKERLLQWCRDKTRDYENVKLENFSTSWADGLAFCALVHHFLPNAFDYSKLTADKRRHNFTLAFKVADEKAGIYPLLDVDDMVAMRKPDWKCVFTYVQSIHRRFKDQQ